jgi:hypothetical protein
VRRHLAAPWMLPTSAHFGFIPVPTFFVVNNRRCQAAQEVKESYEAMRDESIDRERDLQQALETVLADKLQLAEQLTAHQAVSDVMSGQVAQLQVRADAHRGSLPHACIHALALFRCLARDCARVAVPLAVAVQAHASFLANLPAIVCSIFPSNYKNVTCAVSPVVP